MRANAEGAAALAEACTARNIATVNFSSDLVFGSASRATYRESDTPAPLNVYGESKWRMEQAIAGLPGEHLVVRTAAFFSPDDPHNFAVAVVNRLRRGERFAAAADCSVSPTYVPHLCNATLDLLIDGETGVWHLSNGELVSWAQFAVRISRACGLDEGMIDFVSSDELGWKASRPAASALASERGAVMPALSQALELFAQELERRA
jgi:dTDP-4-dehydrorhamnose reductase